MFVTATPACSLELVPLGVGALGLLAHLTTGSEATLWLVAGFATGHSLSGST